MKTFVFVNRVYPPVRGATGELLKELAEGLAGGDARVIVVTSRGPSELELPHRQTVNGVEVVRVGSVPFSRGLHWRRALSYLSLYPALMWQVRKVGKVDAVVSMTDPPLQVAAVTLASRRTTKKIHWAQDVYPELAEELGVIGRVGLFSCSLRMFSTRALRKQDKIVAVGRCMRERIIRRGVEASKIEVIPNWSSVQTVAPEDVQKMRDRLGWTGQFIALYSGNIGLAHDFDTLLESAKMLRGTGVHMAFAGEGPRLAEIRHAAAGLDNVSFLLPQPAADLGAFLQAADLHLVTVRAGLEGLVVPSKAYGILAAGRPVMYVGSSDSEIAKLLSESGAGVVVANGNARGLTHALTEIRADPARGRMMGECGLKLYGHFTVEKAVERWQAMLD